MKLQSAKEKKHNIHDQRFVVKYFKGWIDGYNNFKTDFKYFINNFYTVFQKAYIFFLHYHTYIYNLLIHTASLNYKNAKMWGLTNINWLIFLCGKWQHEFACDTAHHIILFSINNEIQFVVTLPEN